MRWWWYGGSWAARKIPFLVEKEQYFIEKYLNNLSFKSSEYPIGIGDDCAVIESNESLITSKGEIKCKKVGFAVAGNTSRLWKMTGLNSLPIESHKLQAFVSEPLKPLLDQVVVFGVGGAHFYISQFKLCIKKA